MRPQCRVEKLYKPKNLDKATFYSPVEARAMPATTSQLPEEREFVVDSKFQCVMS